MLLPPTGIIPFRCVSKGWKTSLNKLSGWELKTSAEGYEGKGDAESHGTKAVFQLTLVLTLTQVNEVKHWATSQAAFRLSYADSVTDRNH
jgi:hypothetical protein